MELVRALFFRRFDTLLDYLSDLFVRLSIKFLNHLLKLFLNTAMLFLYVISRYLNFLVKVFNKFGFRHFNLMPQVFFSQIELLVNEFLSRYIRNRLDNSGPNHPELSHFIHGHFLPHFESEYIFTTVDIVHAIIPELSLHIVLDGFANADCCEFLQLAYFGILLLEGFSDTLCRL